MAEERVRQAALSAQGEIAEGENRTTESAPANESSDPDQLLPNSTGKKFRSLCSVWRSDADPAKFALLLTLSTLFLRIGTVTFGGGFVMIPLIEAEVVDSHRWLTSSGVR